MLKYLLLALAVATLATQTALADSRLSGAVTTRHLYKADSTNTTVTLVSADDARVTRAAGLLLSVDASDTIKLNCGSVTKAAFFLGARSGLAQTFYPLTLECRAKSSNLAGTVSTTVGSATITGVGASFTQDFAPGDRIVITGGNTLTIQTVSSNTSMTASSNATSAASGAVYQRGADNLNLVKGVATTSVHASLWFEQER